MIRTLRWASLFACLALTSHWEWQAGSAVLTGAGRLGLVLAFAVPAAVDCYVMTAFLSGRDLGWALGLLWLSVLGGALHAATRPEQAGLAAAVGTVIVVVLWRVDEAFRAASEQASAELARQAAEQAEQVERERQDRAARTAELTAKAEADRAEVERLAAEQEREAAKAARSAEPRTRPARYAGPRLVAGSGSTDDRVIEALGRGPASVGQLSADLSIPKGTVKSSLDRLRKAERIRPIGSGPSTVWEVAA